MIHTVCLPMERLVQTEVSLPTCTIAEPIKKTYCDLTMSKAICNKWHTNPVFLLNGSYFHFVLRQSLLYCSKTGQTNKESIVEWQCHFQPLLSECCHLRCSSCAAACCGKKLRGGRAHKIHWTTPTNLLN